MTAPTLLWLRRDLRLDDHPALLEAMAQGGPVLPVFILDGLARAQGAAFLWRLEGSLKALAADLAARGGRLILRRGEAAETLEALARETGATAVVWSRLYDPASIARDTAVKARLKAAGLRAESRPGRMLFEPWALKTGAGGPYQVYTPFSKAAFAAAEALEPPRSAPALWPAPEVWPASEPLEEWRLGTAMNRGAAVLARWSEAPGEASAHARMRDFLDRRLSVYGERRDALDGSGSSGLSAALAHGELSVRRLWFEARERPGAGPFLRELIWREFAAHLLYHYPKMGEENWHPSWSAFPWRPDNEAAERWRRGMTGVAAVDAAMRELWTTGLMSNRARMIVASFLTKHLLTHWRVGLDWFRDQLIDHDEASNAMNWQWAAGSGPDAAPYFRIFNPDTQAERFDADGSWRRGRIAELAGRAPGPEALAFFEAVPRAWGFSPERPYPAPVVDLAEGRALALAAYASLKG